MADYTHKNLEEVEDSAPGFGMPDGTEARFAREAFDAQDTGFAFHRLAPNVRHPFGHKHENAEEVYVVIRGSGRAKIDDEVLDLKTLDAIRVAPSAVRAMEAGPDGIEVLVFGAHHDGDGELLPGWWKG